MGLTRRDAMTSAALLTAAATAPSVPAAAGPKAKKPVPKQSVFAAKARQTLLLDFGWRFHLGHASNPNEDFSFGADQRSFAKAGYGIAKPAEADFDDSDWQAVNLPHDWALDLPFVPSANPPTDPKVEDPRAAHGFKPLGREYPETSIGWYRKTFPLPASDLGKRLSLQFDGVFRAATVLFNGYIVATGGSGYRSFTVDVSEFVNYGGKNVLTVRVDASLGEGWFYEGAGIYRHVWLIKQDRLHIAPWGVFAKPVMSGKDATLTIATDIVNDAPARSARLVSTIYDPSGRQVAVLKSPPLSLGAGERRTVTQVAHLAGPQLWSPDTPALYRVVSEIETGGKVADDCVTAFGVRSFRFDPAKGFFLNGKPLKLKGTCNHQDHGGIGAAIPDALQDWRIKKLKEFGSNAYRASHNPPTPELLDACDRLGMLVIDETRRMSCDDESLSDLAAMIRRDRNHPCVILWSIGNEEPQQTTERGARIALAMKRLCNEMDSTRPITAAVDNPDGWGAGIGPVLDVIGANYRTPKIPGFLKTHPKAVMIGTETGSTVAARGVYARDPKSGYCAAYDTEHPWWASTAEDWMQVAMPDPAIAGGFVWTGFDYRGEPTPFNQWPNVSSQFGILDTCGFAKDNMYYYKAWWSAEPVLHLFPHWNWKPGDTVNVWCHTNLDAVELFLNGASLGVKKMAPYSHVEWDVGFVPGALEAKGYKNGAVVLSAKRETAGAAAQIRLSCDRTALKGDGEDAAMIRVEITDAAGCMVPMADHRVTFRVSGAGALIGVGNGDPKSHESDRADNRAAFNGLCAAVIQAAKGSGAVHIEATSPGLQTASLSLPVETVWPRPSL